MKCDLCEKFIECYNPEFHHLKIDDAHAIDMCQECLDKIIKWKGSRIAKLFPTKMLKKRFGKEK